MSVPESIQYLSTKTRDPDSFRIAFDPKRSRIFRGFLSMFVLNTAGGYGAVAPVLADLDVPTLTALKRLNEINLAHIKRGPVLHRLQPVAAAGAAALLLWQQLSDTKPLTWTSTYVLRATNPGFVSRILVTVVTSALVLLILRILMDAIVVGRAAKYVTWFGEIIDLAIVSATTDAMGRSESSAPAASAATTAVASRDAQNG